MGKGTLCWMLGCPPASVYGVFCPARSRWGMQEAAAVTGSHRK